MKRIITLGLTAVIGMLCALGVIPGTTTSAVASDGQGYWDTYFSPVWDDDETGHSAFDKVYNFIFGPDGVGIDPSTGHWEECTPGEAAPWCNQISAGYAPSPTGVPTMFAKAPAAAGVTVKSGNSAVTGLGMVFDFLGASASQLTVDTNVTDLAIESAGMPGWLQGTNQFHWGANSTGGTAVLTWTITTAPAFGSTQGFTVSRTGTMAGTYPAPNATVEVWHTDGTHDDFAGFGCDYRFVSQCTNPQTLTRANGWTAKPFDHFVFRFPAKDGAPSGSLTWYPPGHSLYPPNLGGMVGSVESTYVCRDSTGTTSNYYRSVDVASSDELVNVGLDAFRCEPDELLLSALVEWVTDTGREVIYDYNAPEWVVETPAEWQDCGTKNCELKLYNGTQYCGQYAVGCPDWWESEDEEAYTCKYGSHIVGLEYCAIFRKPGQQSATGVITVNPQGEPEYTGPKDQPREWFDEIDTRRPVPDPNPTPPGVVTPGVGDPTPNGSACFPSGWGLFNPLEWVYRPTTCALTWAFVPRADVVQGNLDGAQAAIDGHGIFRVVGDAAALPGAIGDGWSGNCENVGFDVHSDAVPKHQFVGVHCSPATDLEGGASSVNALYVLSAAVIGVSSLWGCFLIVRRHFGGHDS